LSGESDRSVRHTHEVLENLQDLLISMQSVESGYRGFALTGSEKYSESFHADILRWQQDLTALRNLIEDNPTQQRQFLTLERLANQKFEFGETVISLCQTKGLAAAADSIRSGPGQRIMDDFQGAIRGLQDEELRLLVLRNADAKRRLGQTKIVLILGTVLFLLIAAAAGWSVQRDTSGRGLTEEALRDSEERYRMLLDGVQDYAIYSWTRRARLSVGMPVPNESKVIQPNRSSVTTFPASFLLKISSGAGRWKYSG